MYVAYNENSYDQKCNISTLGPQRLHWAASEKNLVIFSFTYSVILFPFWVEGEEKQKLFINCSVPGNRKPGNSSWINMRLWLGCQVWFNSRRPFRDGPTMSTRDKTKPPVIKVMHILFTFAPLCWNSPLFALLSAKAVLRIVCVCVSVCGRVTPAPRSHWETASCW